MTFEESIKYSPYNNGFIIKIIQEHDEGDQIRTHKKRRINKKWLKRYGVYGPQKLAKDEVLVIDGCLCMSRPHFRKLASELNWRKSE